ncbi:hypothetical protein [Nocardia sp. NPDC051832]|uniref:DUF7373 family lipoprotein n=1 Tax=Nocardia sp. NPDC051832 TaxID=3155673 RepID=UPI00342DC611
MARRLAAMLAAAVFAVSGCGGDAEPTSAAPQVDTSKLDPGNYPTTPLDLEQSRTDATGLKLEAIRIASVTPLLMEIDNRLVFEPATYVSRLVVPPNVESFLGTPVTPEGFDAVAPGLLSGWYTRGLRRADMSLGLRATLYTLRFSTADQAASAVRQLGDRMTGDPVTIPNHPAARATALAEHAILDPWLSAWLAHGDLVLHVEINDPLTRPFDPGNLATLAQRIFDAQIAALQNFAPTPADQVRSLPLDVDGLLSRTLPMEEGQRSGGMDPSALYPGQAALHIENKPNLAKAAFEDSGVDYVTIAGTRVYRARDAASATRLSAALQAQSADQYAPIESPPNLPGAQCLELTDKYVYTSKHVCWITVGRYVARVPHANVQGVHQRTSAQYILLANGV